MRWVWWCVLGSLFLGAAWFSSEQGWGTAAAVLALIMLIFWAAGVGLYVDAQARLAVSVFERRRAALAVTPESELFRLANSMHPKTVELLLQHRKIVWRVKEADIDDLCDWVLDADPRIGWKFVEYVLRFSTETTIMPKNRFPDSTSTWSKLINDRELYEAFYTILRNRNMVTEYGPAGAGQWIEPWNPRTVAKHFGLKLDLGDEVMEVG